MADTPDIEAKAPATPTILVADDEPTLLRLMAFVLQRRGYAMITATNGVEALQKIRENRPDLVVLDVMMPRKDGFQVATEVRADPELAATPIIMLSAKAQDEDIERGLAIGVSDYITKPFEPDKLAEAVAAALAGETAPQEETNRVSYATVWRGNAMAAGDVSVQESWTVEPELTEAPPRRIAPSGYADLNKPNDILFQGIGAGLIIAGIVMLIFGASRGLGAWTFLGIFLALVGMLLAVLIVPTLKNRHLTRAKHLTENGVPVMARVLSADNMGGDHSYGRMVKFQVTTPTGELTHRTTHADDRLLPRKIPGNVTALLDIQTGDVELYCALPFRAVPKTSGAAAPATPATPTRTAPASLPNSGIRTPVAEPAPPPTGAMGTLNIDSLPQRPAAPPPDPEPAPPRPAPKQEKQDEDKQERPAAPASLPWE